MIRRPENSHSEMTFDDEPNKSSTRPPVPRRSKDHEPPAEGTMEPQKRTTSCVSAVSQHVDPESHCRNRSPLLPGPSIGCAETPPQHTDLPISRELLAAALRIVQEVRAIHELVNSYDRSTVEDAVMVIAQLQHRMDRRSLKIAREVEIAVRDARPQPEVHEPAVVSDHPLRVCRAVRGKQGAIASGRTKFEPLDASIFENSIRPADVSPVPSTGANDVGSFPVDGAGFVLDAVMSVSDDVEYPDPSLSYIREETDDDDDDP